MVSAPPKIQILLRVPVICKGIVKRVQVRSRKSGRWREEVEEPELKFRLSPSKFFFWALFLTSALANDSSGLQFPISSGSSSGSLIKACYTPELNCEFTLLPSVEQAYLSSRYISPRKGWCLLIFWIHWWQIIIKVWLHQLPSTKVISDTGSNIGHLWLIAW